MNKAILLVCSLCIPFIINAQFSFTNRSNWLSDPTVRSGAPIAVADMNGDGRDDIVRLDATQSLKIEYQPTSGGFFSGYTYGQLIGTQWGICIADVDKNGYNDIFTGGAYNGLKLLKANSSGTGYTLNTISIFPIFLQGCNFADINNDGNIDIFACHDDGVSQAYRNLGNGNFVADTSLIYPASTVPSDNSGNYGSVWIDYDNDRDLDLYISKCRLGVSNPNDGRRLNLLFTNDGNNDYMDMALENGLRPFAQSWATDFADIDNDGDLDALVVTHDTPNKLYINNGSGQFTEITAQSGISTSMNAAGLGIQVKFEDFDNDGYVDILYTTNGSNHCLLRNNGNNTFTNFPNAFPTSNRIHSAATGDLNNDGYIDVIAGFGSSYNSPSSTPDALFINNGGSNKFLKVRLEGSASNPNGIGSRIEVYGAWGIQIREVRSGESYGIQTSLTKHFGLGEAFSIDSLVVRWPSGTVDRIANPGINQTIVVVEGSSCVVAVDFTAIPDGLSIDFQDNSLLGATQWLWTFGDGATSTLQNPQHNYATPGVYQVCLQASGFCGSAQHCELINVNCAVPQAVFGHSSDNLTVQFQDQSFNTPTNWFWTFGDGGNSVLQNPEHHFSQPGTYNVCLLVSNGCGMAQVCEQLTVDCAGAQVGFGFHSTELSVEFSDLTVGGATQWEWDFDDGNSSNEQNPDHLYEHPGTYHVCLTALTVCGSLTVCDDVTVSCAAPSVNIDYTGNGLDYGFTATSSDMVETWTWNFGDGTGSTEQNPQHIYPGPGNYLLCLIASNQCGDNELCVNLTINCAPPAAAFEAQINGLVVQFNDISSPGTESWLWDFGDGITSTEQSPQHTYQLSGTYEICQTVSSACGDNQVCTTITLTCPPSQAAFSYQINQSTVNFTNNSTNNPILLNWYFGDGAQSNEDSPQHTYAQPGTYNVCLFATNACGSTQQCVEITIGCPSPQPVFSAMNNGLEVAFTDDSSDAPTQWSWTFGDGAVSSLESPNHTYAAPGTYEVCLTTTNACGSAQICENITVSCLAPAANYSVTTNQLQATFTTTATNDPSQWHWEFGDGASSDDPNPVHTYIQPGSYLVCLTVSSVCGTDEFCNLVPVTCAAPQASFNADVNNLAVSFSDQSNNAPTSWLWSFGDGMGATAQNPMHSYSLPGTYQVCLQAGSICGTTQLCQTITVSCPAPQAGFSFDVNGLEVGFSDQSSSGPTSWTWSFGDGFGSTLQNPTHLYDLPGTYQVCLQTSSLCGTTQQCQTVTVVCPAPQAGFSFQTQQLLLTFTDQSENQPTQWSWTFGDGASSSAQNPQHTYADPGMYQVCLTASSNCGSDQFCQTITVTCFAPQANFSITANFLEIQFSDLTTNTPTSWFWSFGDGTIATTSDPTHMYSLPGNYLVCLTAANSCGSTQRCEQIQVNCAAPAADFSADEGDLSVQFMDLSSNTPSQWLWDFGDGGASAESDPLHTYAQPGDYEVCLTVTNNCGTTQVCNTITVSCAGPVAAFSPSGVGIAVLFLDASENAPTTWKWDFGDGSGSDQQNPFHMYAAPGNYIVCLIVSNLCGVDSICQTLLVVTDLASEPIDNISWRIAPNPTAGILQMHFECETSSQIIIKAYNTLGVEVWRREKTLQNGMNDESIDLSDWPSGAYWWVLTTTQSQQVLKVIKQ